MRIKCIFQGGGANLVTLLAAAEALGDIEAAGNVEVAEVAGTSAGAIAAYCFASNTPTREFRYRIKEAGAIALQKMKSGVNGNPSFFSYRSLKAMFRLATGRSILDREIVREFIRHTTASPETNEKMLYQLRIPMHSTAVNLRVGDGRFYRSSNIQDTIEDALMDACSIPFIFHGYSSDHHIVDGGVSFNLPSPEIFEPDDEAYKVVAFSFEDENRSAIVSLRDYVNAIVGTVIDRSIDSASNSIEESGGRVVKLPRTYGTLDFDVAVNEGLNDQEFVATKEVVKSRLEEALSHLRQIPPNSEVSHSLNPISNDLLKAIHERDMDTNPYRVASSTVLVVPTPLFDDAGYDGNGYDQLTKIVGYEPERQSLKAVKIGLARGQANAPVSLQSCHAVDRNDNPVPLFTHVVSDLQDDAIRYSALVFFVDEIPAGRCPVSIRFTTRQRGMMRDLEQNGRDFVMSSSGNSKNLPLGRTLVALPNAGAGYCVRDLSPLTPQDYAQFELDPATAPKMQLGNAISPQECYSYLHLVNGLQNPGILGWEVENVPGGTRFGMWIEQVVT